MNTAVHGPDNGVTAAGPLSLALAILALVSFAWIWLISVSTGFDPPEWLRIAGSSLLPVGLVGSVVAGAIGLRTPTRGYAVAGLATTALVVAAFTVLYSLLV